jgi:hypothetical protein
MSNEIEAIIKSVSTKKNPGLDKFIHLEGRTNTNDPQTIPLNRKGRNTIIV